MGHVTTSFTSACMDLTFVLLHSYFHKGRIFNESIIRIHLIFLFQNFGLWNFCFHGGRLFYALELWSIACESFPIALFGLYLKLISYVYSVFWGLPPLTKGLSFVELDTNHKRQPYLSLCSFIHTTSLGISSHKQCWDS